MLRILVTAPSSTTGPANTMPRWGLEVSEMATKAKARTWARRLSEAFDMETGAEGDPKAFNAIAQYLEVTETDVPDDFLGAFAACTHESYKRGQQAKG